MSLVSKMAIYQIRNVKNNKVYVGSSVNVKRRLRSHRSLLLKGVHHSIHLQRAFNIEGKDVFVFEILEYVNDTEELLDIEQFWIDKLDSCNDKKGYNIALQAGAPMAGRKQSEEANAKTGAASKRWHRINKGTPKYDKYLNNLSKSLVGHEVSEETRAKIAEKARLRTGESNPFFGRNHTEETKRKISLKNLGRPRSKDAKRKTSETLKKKRVNQGSANGSAKLTESSVLDIKRRLLAGEKQADIASDFAVSPGSISNIQQGKTWKHLVVM